MTLIEQIQQIIEDEAEKYQNKGCVEHLPIFENARTRWAKQDFKAGAEFLMPLIERLVKQRNFIYKCYENDDIKYWSGSAQEFIAEDNQELLNILKEGK